MPICNRVSRFKANTESIVVSEFGPNKLLGAQIRFSLYEEFLPEGWADIAAENLEITHTFYMQGKDGNLIESSIDRLKRALQWDGIDPFALETRVDMPCKITTKEDTYQDKTRIVVEWLNHIDDDGPGAKKLEEADRKRITAALGAKFRALSGGTPIPTKPKPVLKPAKPKPVPGSTEDVAWAAFVDARAAIDEDESARESAWYDLLTELTGKNDTNALNPQDWGKVVTYITEAPV